MACKHLIFDDLATQGDWQRPVMVRSGRDAMKPARARRGVPMHEYCFENIRNPTRARRAKATRQFPTSQVDIILNVRVCILNLVLVHADATCV